jgi:hypothetical protein
MPGLADSALYRRRMEKIAESLADYIKILDSDFAKDQFRFRGQEHDWPLLPRLARLEPRHGDHDDLERLMIEQLQLEGTALCETVPSNKLEWLVVAQQHGMSTRLLDWTSNPLAALWFAVRPHVERAPTDTAVVYVISFDDEDVISVRQEMNAFGHPRAYLLRPPHIAKRITAQAGWFTTHPIIIGNSFQPLDKDHPLGSNLSKVLIPAECVSDMRWALDRCGVNEATLFGDLVALCQHLDWAHARFPGEA